MTVKKSQILTVLYGVLTITGSLPCNMLMLTKAVQNCLVTARASRVFMKKILILS